MIAWFKTYFVDVLKYQYFDFTGRATRTQFWFFVLIEVIVFTLFVIVATLISLLIKDSYLFFILVVYMIAMVIPRLAIAARRLRDVGLSPFWLFLVLLPYIGAFVLLIMYVLPSEAFQKAG